VKILMIDDSKNDQELTKEYINLMHLNEKWIIDTANNMTSGLKKLSKNTYDVVLLDLSLPETEGIETIDKIMEFLPQAKKENKKIPIVILTGQEDFSIGKQALKKGAQDFLIKDKTKEKELYRAINFATYEKNMPERGFFSRRRKRKASK